jgi:hypothetical protein
MANKFEEIKQLVENVDVDAVKAYKGNKAAGVRVRRFATEVSKLARELRTETLELASQD